jgi:hypothetical protein
MARITIAQLIVTEQVDEEERELMDLEAWDWDNPVEVDIAEDLRIQPPIAVTFEEHRHLAAAARAAGLTVHAFIKRTALEAAHPASMPTS